MKKRLLALILSVLLIAGLVAGCSGGKTEPGAATKAPAGDSEAPGGDKSGEPQESGRTDLVIAIAADIATLHPSDHTTTAEIDIEAQIYDTLYRASLDGNEPQPRLATSYEISEDGKQYTFHLRKDATFHDGTPIKASDVVFSANLYKQSKYQNAIVAGLSEAKAIDDYTVVFTTETVYSPFLESIMDMHIASEAYFNSVDAETFANKPMGSGPYKFVSHEAGSKIILEAYDGYYLGAPSIKNVTYKVIPDDTTVAVALQTGEVGFADINESNYRNLSGKEGVVIDEYNMSRFGFISMNHEKFPYSEVKFRQAIAYAINRQNVVDLTLDGLGTVNSNILSPLRFGYSDKQPQYTYDTEKAKQLLEECGIETPYDLGVMYVSEAYSTLAQVIQSDLAAVGLNCTIEILEANAYYGKLLGGECGMTVLEMTLEGSTQQFSLAFMPEYIGGANNARYSDEEVSQWFKDAVAAVDDEERFEIYNKIFTKVQEQAVYVVMYNTIGLYAHSADLKCPHFELEGRYYIYDFSW
ncbi:MAG: ABC transporter substrate-binding protein [Oscillospiraceae bacterium]|jgi:peptide/nickel transport system substrate-binding protein